ncbi:MAG TPA: hypothetical protein VGD52_24960 [Pseudoduganella sp.]
MWHQVRAHLSGNWPIYRQGLGGVACVLVLWGAFELLQQNLELFGLGGIDPVIFTMGWMICLFACYGHFASRIMREVKKKQGREK